VVANDFPKEYPKDWEYLVKHMSNIWNKYNQYYIDLGKSK